MATGSRLRRPVYPEPSDVDLTDGGDDTKTTTQRVRRGSRRRKGRGRGRRKGRGRGRRKGRERGRGRGEEEREGGGRGGRKKAVIEGFCEC